MGPVPELHCHTTTVMVAMGRYFKNKTEYFSFLKLTFVQLFSIM